MNSIRLSIYGLPVIFSLIALASCSAPPYQSTAQLRVGDCEIVQADISDPAFLELEGAYWQYTQHAGERSYSVDSREGVLRFTRIGTQPWAIFTQQVAVPIETGMTLLFSAELKGEITAEGAFSGIDPIAGLFLQPSIAASSASLAEHTPNSGSWDWQSVSVESEAFLDAPNITVGFIHQGGGTLWARNPTLEVVACRD